MSELWLLGLIPCLIALLVWRIKTQKQMSLVVTYQKQVTDQLFIFRLKRPWWSRFIALPKFQAGQALAVQLPKDETQRYYSIANWAKSPSYYELAVKREEYGRFSPRLCGYVRKGARLSVGLPQGGFVLQRSYKSRAVLIASGIGVTPLLAMYQQWQQTKGNKPYANLSFYWQLRFEQDALYRDELGYQARIIYSRPNYGQGQHLSAQTLVQELGGLSDCDFYLCGSPVFMNGLIAQLKQAGVSANSIFTESFSGLSGGASYQQIHYQGQDFSCAGYGNLLAAIEAQGLSIKADCRSGFCGCCEVRLEQGRASHFIQPEFQPRAGCVLACCALPDTDVWVAQSDKV